MADDPIAVCAQAVAKGDPDRFAATMAAPVPARTVLFPLYAFNLEVARAPWMSREPMVAQMRLQFWTDVLDCIGDGRPVPQHEISEPLAQAVRETGLDVALLHGIVAARVQDIAPEGFADADALWQYLDATAGNLMWAAALALGAPERSTPAVRGMAHASGLANYLLAVPALEAAGRQPLPDTDAAAIAALANDGLARLTRARAARATVPHRASPALLAGWRSRALLTLAAQSPERVRAGALAESDFARRGALLMRTISGRW